MGAPGSSSRIFIARHGETVFNAAGRIQGDHEHTPLSRRGFAQAEAMGRGLARHLNGAVEAMRLIASDTGRTLQTLATICEHIGADWHAAETEPRLREIGMGEWSGRYYRDLLPDFPDLLHPEHRLFRHVAPGGEDYSAVAARLSDWLAATDLSRDMLIVSHGMTSRVLRGLLLGRDAFGDYGAPIAPALPQGTLVMIEGGKESVLVEGRGEKEKA